MGVGIAHAHAPLLTFAPLHVNDDGSKLRKPTVGGRCWRRCSEGFEAGKSCVFQAMKEDHIVRLLQCSGMTVGGHALLWELWERDSSPCSRPNRSRGDTPQPEASPSSASSSSSSVAMSSPEDRKELFKRYQLKMKEMKGSKKPFAPPRHMKIQVGGMLFDESLGKGVRKRYIPASQTITFSANATYDLVIQKSQEIFFPDEAREQEDSFCLADSSGIPYEIGNKCEWKLSEFVQGLKLPPSKLRLYVMYRPKDPTDLLDDDKDDTNNSGECSEDREPVQPPPLIHQTSTSQQAKPVIQKCVKCFEPFRTYVPGVDTVMPDGNSFFYSTPQQECPVCDISHWGWQWNIDLFPQFAKK